MKKVKVNFALKKWYDKTLFYGSYYGSENWKNDCIIIDKIKNCVLPQIKIIVK